MTARPTLTFACAAMAWLCACSAQPSDPAPVRDAPSDATARWDVAGDVPASGRGTERAAASAAAASGQESDGAAAGRTAEATPRAGRPPEAERLIAFGNEPFWSVEVIGGGLLWKTPDNISGTRLPADRQATLHGYRWAGSDGTHRYALDVVAEACSDGMSDRQHVFSSRWELDGRVLQGCARRPDASGE